ncbi:MAG TPA: DUF6356 family protein [Paucimonas sp.]|nr:DUF6356 family protein [Paucimonas sp.]
MKKFLAPFTEHPASVGEGYFTHMAMATGFGIRMIACGLACLIHAVLPFLFVTVGRDTITRLHDKMVVNRSRHAQSTARENAAGSSRPSR